MSSYTERLSALFHANANATNEYEPNVELSPYQVPFDIGSREQLTWNHIANSEITQRVFIERMRAQSFDYWRMPNGTWSVLVNVSSPLTDAQIIDLNTSFYCAHLLSVQGLAPPSQVQPDKPAMSPHAWTRWRSAVIKTNVSPFSCGLYKPPRDGFSDIGFVRKSATWPLLLSTDNAKIVCPVACYGGHLDDPPSASYLAITRKWTCSNCHATFDDVPRSWWCNIL